MVAGCPGMQSSWSSSPRSLSAALSGFHRWPFFHTSCRIVVQPILAICVLARLFWSYCGSSLLDACIAGTSVGGAILGDRKRFGGPGSLQPPWLLAFCAEPAAVKLRRSEAELADLQRQHSEAAAALVVARRVGTSRAAWFAKLRPFLAVPLRFRGQLLRPPVCWNCGLTRCTVGAQRRRSSFLDAGVVGLFLGSPMQPSRHAQL